MEKKSQKELEELMHQAQGFCEKGLFAQAFDCWKAAAENDVLEAYMNIVRLFGRACASTSDIAAKQHWCKQTTQLLDESTIRKFDICDLPLGAAIIYTHTAETMETSRASPEDVSTYYNIAGHFYQLAFGSSKMHDPLAQATAINGFSCLLAEGNGIKKDEKKAYNTFVILARDAHFGEAMFNLAIMHYHEKGCPEAPHEKQLETARDWCVLAARFLPDRPCFLDVKKEVEEAITTIENELRGAPRRPSKRLDKMSMSSTPEIL